MEAAPYEPNVSLSSLSGLVIESRLSTESLSNSARVVGASVSWYDVAIGLHPAPSPLPSWRWPARVRFAMRVVSNDLLTWQATRDRYVGPNSSRHFTKSLSLLNSFSMSPAW